MFTILIFGFLFGAILRYAKLNRYNSISGLAMLNDFTVAKSIATAIGMGIILINVEIGLGLASYHVKPLIFGGVILGGLIFGSGMAILGYCPGTLPVSAGEGSLDALIGIVGGLFGGLIYTALLPTMENFLGPNAGKLSLKTVIDSNGFVFYALILIIGLAFIWIAFLLHNKERSKNYKWLHAGIALAILNSIVFLTVTTNRPIGASTSYPFVADFLSGVKKSNYFAAIQKSGNWELIFLTGALLAGLIISLIRKEFKLTLIHKNWKNHRSNSSTGRIIWAFIGGFVLIFGARMAGGCTSGHILSGGMQLAFSSLIFTIFAFAGLVITGKFFYKQNKTNESKTT